MHVPLVDLPIQFKALRTEVMSAIEAILDSGQLFLGPHTRAFEDEFAAYCGSQTAIGVANGTDALHLALRAAGIGAGDEVITVANTFIATIEAIHQAGARPILVDVDPRTFNMAVEHLEQSITPRTRAIVPVHLYGRLADMEAILPIARRHGLTVIEDASQAQGARDARGRLAGSIGDAGCFSFYYAKNLGAYGEAGAITTSNADLDRRVRLLRSHGEARRYEHEVLGYNSRIDEIQAAVLRIKLRHLDAWNEQRRGLAARYYELLSDLPLGQPELLYDGSHVYHQYVVRVPERDQVREFLASRGVGTGVHYPIPVHLQAACQFLGYSPGDMPHTEQAAGEVLSLPMYPELLESQQQQVAEALTAALGRSGADDRRRNAGRMART
jgi:dTDP-4-amino-4,6-dideoxygalactose transaminase